jgi:hypothetical protein
MDVHVLLCFAVVSPGKRDNLPARRHPRTLVPVENPPRRILQIVMASPQVWP